MKKFVIPSLLFLALGMNSCQKCVECDNCPFGITGDTCMDEWDSKEDYEAAIANAEALGCSCTEKLKGIIPVLLIAPRAPQLSLSALGVPVPGLLVLRISFSC